MINVHKNHLLRLTAAIFLFVSMLVQVQVLFACDYMDNSLQKTCCCEDKVDKTSNKTDSCCDVDVSLNTGINIESLYQKHESAIVTADTETEAPSSLIAPPPFITATPESPFTPIYSTIDTAWYNASDTYLLTHRFRE